MSWSFQSEAAEKRCGELGANCVCARSLEAAGWRLSGTPVNGYSNNWVETNQNASDAMLCGYFTSEGKRGVYIEADGAASVATGLNGRPALNATGMVISLAPGDDQWKSLVARAGRVGIRYYFKLGPGYMSTDVSNPLFPGPTTCTNDKYTQLGQYFTANTNGFYWNGDSGTLNFGLAPANVIGDWIRLEHYVRIDASGNPGPHEVYFTNVTRGYTKKATNLPDGAGFGKQAIDGFHEIIHRYRAAGQDNGIGKPCTGSSMMMYAIMAHWPTDQGQLIGPASELEGGTIPPPVAATPTSPTTVIVQ